MPCANKLPLWGLLVTSQSELKWSTCWDTQHGWATKTKQSESQANCSVRAQRNLRKGLRQKECSLSQTAHADGPTLSVEINMRSCVRIKKRTMKEDVGWRVSITKKVTTACHMTDKWPVNTVHRSARVILSRSTTEHRYFKSNWA